jgi:hypothetical protein
MERELTEQEQFEQDFYEFICPNWDVDDYSHREPEDKPLTEFDVL